jgi:hypothetical protein
LKRALNTNKTSLTDRKVHTRFACNKQDLLTFALEMGAGDSTIFLAKKFGKTHSQMNVVSNKKIHCIPLENGASDGVILLTNIAL